MSTIDYRTKLKSTRFVHSSISGRDFNEEMESDRGRAINSAAVRRLQQKTQVFPLEINAAVRSRLTHSLEVQQVGRYITKIILNHLKKDQLLTEFGLDGYEEGFISAVETACLLHDIGNPPFGHFGEKAINLWAEKFLTDEFCRKFGQKTIYQEILNDLCSFEGNAQGIRILHKLQALNLTLTQLACVIKYTRCASTRKNPDIPCHYRHKKPGYYLSEVELIEKIRQTLAINENCRFPLTYIMEAADDISYCIADIDDAIDKGILSVEKLHQLISKIWNSFRTPEVAKVIDEGYLPKLSEQALERYHKEKINKNNSYILTLRTTLVNDLCHYAARRYLDNHEQVFAGSLDESLLDGSDRYHFATETLRKLAFDHVFCTPEVENLELKGYAVISGLLHIYSPLIALDYKQFSRLAAGKNLTEYPIETRLYHKLSSKHKETYLKEISQLCESSKATIEIMELYHRVRLVIDYISGMTDGFAVEEYRNLTAIY